MADRYAVSSARFTVTGFLIRAVGRTAASTWVLAAGKPPTRSGMIGKMNPIQILSDVGRGQGKTASWIVP